MDNEPLRALMLEDSEADAELLIDALERAGFAVAAERVDGREAFVRALRAFAPDVIVSDHSLAQFDGHAAIKAARNASPTTPVIIATGSVGQLSMVAFVR